ncbi:hypothetical protein DFQ26_000543 [Actinomortierella ambigua]|nr:hypothetical protein DFQ26_000543 [Actinomortierella ambigua]
MPPAPAKELMHQAKAQPMSISAICSQDDSDEEHFASSPHHHHHHQEQIKHEDIEEDGDDHLALPPPRNHSRHSSQNGFHHHHHPQHQPAGMQDDEDSFSEVEDYHPPSASSNGIPIQGGGGQDVDGDSYYAHHQHHNHHHQQQPHHHHHHHHHQRSSSSSSSSFAYYADDNRDPRAPDADEQLAAEALGNMANGSLASAEGHAASSAPFISRMSSLPIVTSAIKAYESGKQNSKVMKYGAEMVESGVKTLSKPVFDKLEPKLSQLDDFANRQLDRLEKVYPKNENQPFPSPTNSTRSSSDLFRTNSSSSLARPRGDSIDSTSSTASSRPSRDYDIMRSINPRHEEATLRKRSDSQSSQRFQFSATNSANGYYNFTGSSSTSLSSSSHQTPQQQQQQQQQQVGALQPSASQQFSGWRGVVASVSTASAAGVAIFSEESMRSLKYCLQWLQYAVQHIDHQIGLLKAFLVSLASPSSSTEVVPSNAASTLSNIKREVVETLRKVISVVSRYAGACLPDHAKISVRQFILSMPVRWATLNQESVPSTPISSPSLRPTDLRPDQRDALNETSERATKVLVLANESSDMLKSVASIFKDSVDKAENWMGKLRYVGMNPQQNTDGLPSWAPVGFPSSTMPGGFPGSSSGPSSNGANGASGSTGLEQYSLRSTLHHNGTNGTSNGTSNGNGNGHMGSYQSTSPSRSLKSSPRIKSRDTFGSMHHNRHQYRQPNSMSADDEDDSASDSEEPLAMDDSDEEDLMAMSTEGNHVAPQKRSMTSSTYTQGNAVRRRKKRGESAEVVAGLGVTANRPSTTSPTIKQEPY